MKVLLFAGAKAVLEGWIFNSNKKRVKSKDEALSQATDTKTYAGTPPTVVVETFDLVEQLKG